MAYSPLELTGFILTVAVLGLNTIFTAHTYFQMARNTTGEIFDAIDRVRVLLKSFEGIYNLPNSEFSPDGNGRYHGAEGFRVICDCLQILLELNVRELPDEIRNFSERPGMPTGCGDVLPWVLATSILDEEYETLLDVYGRGWSFQWRGEFQWLWRPFPPSAVLRRWVRRKESVGRMLNDAEKMLNDAEKIIERCDNGFFR